MNRSLAFTAVLLFVIQFLSAQTATEAFLLSQSDPLGTARNLGTGNSMFAIGPDFSVIGNNPSGLGGFGKSEFLITGNLGFHHTTSSFVSDSFGGTSNNRGNFTLPNIGFIIHDTPNTGKWISSNWAIGLNRTAQYNREIDADGRTIGSITDSWSENAFGVDTGDLNGFEEGIAYRAGAIYDLDEDKVYETDYMFNDQYPILKSESALRTGGKTEIVLAYGADLDRKFLIGFSVGLPLVNMTETRRYTEADDASDAIRYFNSLVYTRSINTTGYGWNAKFGVTVKPTPFFNIALAFHAPTRLNLSDDFNTTLSYDYTDMFNDGPLEARSPFGSFQYALRTPWSAMGGIGIIAGKSGFLSASAKFTDYSKMKYKFDVRGNGNEFAQIERAINDNIKSTYGTSVQLNVGGELVLATNYRVRGGVQMLQSAYTNDKTFDPSFHLGAGYRGEYVYFDLGYKYATEEEGYLPYETSAAPQPLVVIDQTKHQIAATVGFKF